MMCCVLCQWVWIGLFVVVLGGSEASAQEALMGQPVEDYRARRGELWKRVRDAVGEDRDLVVAVRGSDTRDREDFEEGRFRQNNAFAYLTGVEIPGAFLVMTGDGKATLYLPRGPLGSRFSGGVREVPGPGEESERRFGVDEVAVNDRVLAELLGAPVPGKDEGLRPILYLMNPRPRAEDQSAEARFGRLLREAAQGVEFRDLSGVMGELRKGKSEAEIAILRRAIEVTGNAERAVMEAIEPGMFEYQLEGRIANAFLDGGALRPGFASIVGSGPNAAIPHYFENTRKMESGDLVVVDIGAEIENYTADITRTVPVSGKFSKRQRELYEAVLEAQRAVEVSVKPGKTKLGELTGVARRSLRESGLKGKDEKGNEHTIDHFFIHGVGHYLGMDVHDVGSMGEPLRPGRCSRLSRGFIFRVRILGSGSRMIIW